MGIFDKSALPEHLKSWEAWKGKDDDQHWYTAWRKYIKAWSAFGPRSPHGIAFAFTFFPPFVIPVLRKWRNVPKVLFARKKGGAWRFECDGQEDRYDHRDDPKEFLKDNPGYYLSRNQYWCKEHDAIQWPLFYSFHEYSKAEDVLTPGTKEDRDGKITMIYLGAKRDADRIFWFIAFYVGRNFK